MILFFLFLKIFASQTPEPIKPNLYYQTEFQKFPQYLKDQDFKIVQYSPPRTGSTLLFNILLFLFEEKSHYTTPMDLQNRKVIKSHFLLKETNQKTYYITSIRHPYDIITSRLRKKNSRCVHNGDIQRVVRDFQRVNALQQTKKNLLILKYENFYNNYNYLFDEIEKVFNITISDEDKTKLHTLFSLSSMKKLSAQFEDFSTYDAGVQIHGNHINLVTPNAYKNHLNPEGIKTLKSNQHLQSIINEFYPHK